MTFYRRNLPHWQPDGKSIFLTWRLFGSLPGPTAKTGCVTEQDWGRRFVAFDRDLDWALSGPLWLANPEIADCVERSILTGAELRHYDLQAYVIMPNHVHILIQPQVSLAKITNGIKGVSARNANRLLRRTGQHFWEDESFDHWIRSAAQFERTWRYIERNPVKANLVKDPKEWKWSSANPAVKEKMEASTAKSGCATHPQT